MVLTAYLMYKEHPQFGRDAKPVRHKRGSAMPLVVVLDFRAAGATFPPIVNVRAVDGSTSSLPYTPVAASFQRYFAPPTSKYFQVFWWEEESAVHGIRTWDPLVKTGLNPLIRPSRRNSLNGGPNKHIHDHFRKIVLTLFHLKMVLVCTGFRHVQSHGSATPVGANAQTARVGKPRHKSVQTKNIFVSRQVVY